MPADIMEKLRAEGLLPEDAGQDRETPVASFRPSTSLEKRTPPRPASRPSPVPPSGAPVPQLYSTAPPAPAEDPPPSKMVTAKPPPMPADGEAVATPTPVADAIETPVAFAYPPASQVPKLAEEAPVEEPKDTTALARPPAAAPPSKTTMAIVAALVVLLLIVALIRLRG